MSDGRLLTTSAEPGAHERIGVIADIHGNLPALECVLDALAAQGVTRIVCLGDVCVGGPFPSECIARLRQDGIPTVSGNTDAWAVQHDPDPAVPLLVEANWMHDVRLWGAAQLSASDRDWLAALPQHLTFDLPGGQSLLALHAAPHSDRENVLPQTPPEEILAWFAGVTADVIAVGHTHEPLLRRVDTYRILNPGSIGAPFNRQRLPRYNRQRRTEYAIVEASTTGSSITLHDLRIDPQEWRAAVLASGMPHAERWLSYA